VSLCLCVGALAYVAAATPGEGPVKRVLTLSTYQIDVPAAIGRVVLRRRLAASTRPNRKRTYAM